MPLTSEITAGDWGGLCPEHRELVYRHLSRSRFGYSDRVVEAEHAGHFALLDLYRRTRDAYGDALDFLKCGSMTTAAGEVPAWTETTTVEKELVFHGLLTESGAFLEEAAGAKRFCLSVRAERLQLAGWAFRIAALVLGWTGPEPRAAGGA